jgi:hypothetical protein
MIQAAFASVVACLIATCIPLYQIAKMSIVDSIETVDRQWILPDAVVFFIFSKPDGAFNKQDTLMQVSLLNRAFYQIFCIWMEDRYVFKRQ